MQPALGLTVVVVEDEPLLSMLMEDLLDEIGCTVAATAATVAAGLSAVEHLAFNIAILDVHMRKIRLAGDVDRSKVADLTPGFTGAELANLCNEAALAATRRNADAPRRRTPETGRLRERSACRARRCAKGLRRRYR